MILATRILGEGPPVVVLHGLFGSARNLTGLCRALATRHRVIAMDLRNHGDSPHDPLMTYDVMAADVTQTLAHHGHGSAAVVGHSMGGKVAMRLALSDPGRVERLLVADIAPVTYAPHFRHFAEAMRQLPAGQSRPQADATLAPVVPDPAVRGFLLHNYRPAEGWRIGLDEIAAALPAIEVWEDRAERYDGAACFVTGAQSDYVLQSHRPAIRRAFPQAMFVEIAEAGHWLHAEQPARFNEAVAAFLGDA